MIYVARLVAKIRASASQTAGPLSDTGKARLKAMLEISDGFKSARPRPGIESKAGEARLVVHNQGPSIAADRLERIFEYGVSDAAEGEGEGTSAQRGQGLFVARTYMARMGGTVTARNVDGGVCFDLALPRGPEADRTIAA